MMEYRTIIMHTMFLTFLYFGHMALSLGDENVIIEMANKERRVHELVVSWNVSVEYDVESIVVSNQKEGSQATTYSGTMNETAGEYFIDDLNPDTNYEVCLTVTLAGADSDVCQQSATTCNRCVQMSTIRFVRDDSLIAVICTLGGVLGLVVVASLCWYCARRKLDEEEESESGSAASKQPILLREPETGNGPRSSVDFEDQDIPYIDETNKDATATKV